MGYERSRHNAQHWAIAVEGPMSCTPACPYRQYYADVCCPHGRQPLGDGCVFERMYAHAYASSMCKEFPHLVKHREKEFAQLVLEETNVALLRERIGCRMNRAWDLGSDMYRELDLCARYWTGMHNRFLDVRRRIAELHDEVAEEMEDRRQRTRALSSAIGSVHVPEPYRSWAMDVMREYRAAQAAYPVGDLTSTEVSECTTNNV